MFLRKKVFTSIVAFTLASSGLLLAAACDDDEDPGTTDGDADSDSDGDSDTDVETDSEELAKHCPEGDLTQEGDVWLCTLSGEITEDQDWISEISYLLTGTVFIGDGEATTDLTIAPGTVIFGDTTSPSALVIQRNSTIHAVGTADNPIVFTSAKEEGKRAPSDWGGVIINGNAPLNLCDDLPCEADGECETGTYGGDDAADNSGEMAYVRIEFSGYQIDPETEFNGLALQGVGSGTKLHHIQIHKTSDDSIEFFGGTAQVNYLLLTGTGDDSFDWTQGWSGKAQFVCVQQHVGIEAERGIEADNLEDNNDATPRSMPTLSNFTLVGQPDNAGDTLGIKLRRGTAGALSNFVIIGYDECINIDNDATWAQVADGTLTIDYSIIPEIACLNDGDDTGNLESEWWNEGTGNLEDDAMLTDPQNETAPDFTPESDSPVLGAGQQPSGSFFEDADFMGCMGDDDWTAGWTAYPKN